MIKVRHHDHLISTGQYLKPAFASFDLSAYPKLLAIVANVQVLPAIAAYTATKYMAVF